MNPWPQDKLVQFAELYAEGLSHSLIGEQLGITKNASIGKATRLGFPRRRTVTARARPGPVPGPQKTHRVSTPKPKAVKPEPVIDPGPVPKMLSLMELNNFTCRWPYGDPKEKDFGFCGHVPRAGSSYCEHHTKEAGFVGDPENAHRFLGRIWKR